MARTISLCKGPNRAVRAMVNSRGMDISDIIPPLVRRVDDILHNDMGGGYVREKMYIDNDTVDLLEDVIGRSKKILNAFTYNPIINIGAAIMWDRMGQRINTDSVAKALEFLNEGCDNEV